VPELVPELTPSNRYVPRNNGACTSRLVPRPKTYAQWGCLVMAVVGIAAFLLEPYVLGLADQRRRQTEAEDYLKSLGIALYPNATVVDRLATNESVINSERLLRATVGFRSRSRFDLVHVWYQRALPRPQWHYTTREASRDFWKNWTAERSLEGKMVSVSISTGPGNGDSTVVVYAITSLEP